jgi:hypothetical protein
LSPAPFWAFARARGSSAGQAVPRAWSPTLRWRGTGASGRDAVMLILFIVVGALSS